MAEETIVMTQKAVDRLGWFSRLLTGSFEKKSGRAVGLGRAADQAPGGPGYRAEGPSGLRSRRLGRSLSRRCASG